MSAADNINPRQRRTPQQIAADRQGIIEHVTSNGGAHVRPPKGTSQSDINALVSSGQLRRTVKREFDVVYSPNFNNGQNVSALRTRAYLHLPEGTNPATEVDISAPMSTGGPEGIRPKSAEWSKHHYGTANSLYSKMQETRSMADQVDYREAPELHHAADEAEEAYDNQINFMHDYSDLHGALNKHLDVAHKGLLD